MRITGLATGLDIDEIVTSSMKPYRVKIDQTTQKRDVVEIKQKLYRDIMSDASKFYDKYFDILKSDSLLVPSNYTSIKFTCDSSAVSVIANNQAEKCSYTIEGTSPTASKAVITMDELKNSTDSGYKEIIIKGMPDKVYKVAINDDKTKMAEDLNNKFQKDNINIKVKYSDMAGDDNGNKSGFVFESTVLGSGNNFKIETKNGEISSSTGKDSTVKIKDNKGGVYIVNNEEYNKGFVDIDGIRFKFNGEIPAKGISVEGKTDVNELKDKIINFVNDYNTLIEKLNTLTSTKHDRSYMPLTSDQKKEMSEDEIKLWNERVEKGQLYKDSDLTRIKNSMKDTMRTFMDDSGLNLEKIGIKPVKDYSGTKNGTFIIDESELTKALEEDIEGVMNLFIKKAPEKLTDDELKKMTDDEIKAYEKAKNQTGIFIKLKDTLNNEFKSSTSSLAKKAGISGTATFTNNELTKSISDYEIKLKKMETDFSRRQQALYSKYASLERMMNKLNAQQANLLSQLGMS